MPRTDSLSILKDPSGQDMLAESYGVVIDNIQKNLISSRLKNSELSGDPNTGSIEAKRFTNTAVNAYGTARGGDAAEDIKAKPVTINIDQDKELVNEVEEKDVSLYGVDGLIQKKSVSNEKAMGRELERAFFTEAKTSGTKATLAATAINEQVEELIQLVEKTKNDYVDGVERDMISVVLDTATYGKLRDFIDTAQNANVTTAMGEMGMFHGVNVYSSVYLPTGTTMVAMAQGAIGQPVRIWQDEPDKFPASNAWHFGLFFSYGTKAVMPDLIQYVSA